MKTIKENMYQVDTELCEGTKCIHRYRCYRHSLFQDAIFKGNNFNSINIEECINPGDEEIPGYQYMWLPKKTFEVVHNDN